jgi:cell wall-associated NlpC family hydrolase
VTRRGGIACAAAALLALSPAGNACASAPAPAAVTAGGRAGVSAWGIDAPLLRRAAVSTAAVVRLARGYLGRPYQWSGIGRRGFDCSGLVFHVFQTLGHAVPHSSAAQFQGGTPVPRAALGPGDLVFFRTYTSGPSHVGIYLGAGRFIHASASRGVIISSLIEPYYRARYLGARRY